MQGRNNRMRPAVRVSLQTPFQGAAHPFQNDQPAGPVPPRVQEFRESATKEVRSVTSEVDRAVREAPAIIESSAEEKPQKRLPSPREKTAADDGS